MEDYSDIWKIEEIRHQIGKSDIGVEWDEGEASHKAMKIFKSSCSDALSLWMESDLFGEMLPTTEEILESHDPNKCMRCDKIPTKLVLWAEGRAIAWFCDGCYKEWIGEVGEEEIVKIFDIKDGQSATERWQQYLDRQKQTDIINLYGDKLSEQISMDIYYIIKASSIEDLWIPEKGDFAIVCADQDLADILSAIKDISIGDTVGMSKLSWEPSFKVAKAVQQESDNVLYKYLYPRYTPSWIEAAMFTWGAKQRLANAEITDDLDPNKLEEAKLLKASPSGIFISDIDDN